MEELTATVEFRLIEDLAFLFQGVKKPATLKQLRFYLMRRLGRKGLPKNRTKKRSRGFSRLMYLARLLDTLQEAETKQMVRKISADKNARYFPTTPAMERYLKYCRKEATKARLRTLMTLELYRNSRRFPLNH